MSNRKKSMLNIICVMFLCILSITGCSNNQEQQDYKKKDSIFVSILPQETFVKKIAGDFLNVRVMVKPGHSPSTYEPTPRQMQELSESKIFFAIGVPFENVWLGKIREVNPSIKIVKTQEKITLKPINRGEPEISEHRGEHEGHSHEGLMDPHIWLSPKLVMSQAETMHDSLVELYPDKKNIFDANLEKFQSELKDLDNKIREILKDSDGSVFLVFHPSWGYFADDYGLVQVAIEKEGKEPSAEYMAQLMEFAKKKNIRAIFVQEQFSKQYAQNIAKAINIKVVSLDPLSFDYFNNLIAVAEALKKK